MDPQTRFHGFALSRFDVDQRPVDLAASPDLDLRAAGDGTWHGFWRAAGMGHQFWLSNPLPHGTAAFTVILPFDWLLELRVAAVLRFWRALQHRPAGDWRRDFPPQTRDRHILTLRALDGRLDGASYRQIAEALLGFHGRKADWETDPRKNHVRRLVADGKHYMHGGYRELLHYPVRLPRHR